MTLLKAIHGRILAPHIAPDGIPLTVRKGDSVGIGHRHETWNDYAWCTDRSGSSGWVPLSVLDSREGHGLALEDYSAQQLDVEAGDRVRLMWKAAGWWWCENRDGDRGWLPIEIVEPEQDSSAA